MLADLFRILQLISIRIIKLLLLLAALVKFRCHLGRDTQLVLCSFSLFCLLLFCVFIIIECGFFCPIYTHLFVCISAQSALLHLHFRHQQRECFALLQQLTLWLIYWLWFCKTCVCSWMWMMLLVLFVASEYSAFWTCSLSLF